MASRAEFIQQAPPEVKTHTPIILQTRLNALLIESDAIVFSKSSSIGKAELFFLAQPELPIMRDDNPRVDRSSEPRITVRRVHRELIEGDSIRVGRLYRFNYIKSNDFEVYLELISSDQVQLEPVSLQMNLSELLTGLR